MHKFSHINAFYQIVRYVKKVNNSEIPNKFKVEDPVTFRGTVKLHGTNAGVTCNGESLFPQSRTQAITIEKDNAGFAAFVEKNKASIFNIMNSIRNKHGIGASKNLTLFGEWCGPGIQKGMAINDLPERQWVLFATKVSEGENQEYIDAVPKLGSLYENENIFSIFDGPTWNVTVDFSDPISKERAISKFNNLIEIVEKECPWGKKFGVSGLGEGIVWQPVDQFWGNSDLFFKTKGEKHKVTKSKTKKESISPEVLNSIQEFVVFSVTENRLNQGLEFLNQNGYSLEMKSLGHFLKWISQDIKRECELELEDNNLEWKQVSKAITEKARNFFKAKIQEDF